MKTLYLQLTTQETALTDADQHLLDIVENLRDWHNIPQVSVERPEDVMLVLQRANNFSVARQFGELSKLPPDNAQVN